MNGGLFHGESQEIALAPGAMLLGGFARPATAALRADLDGIIGRAAFRHMLTPGGRRMSVAMTNCGDVGWVSDPAGYRYASRDPLSGEPWPPMPQSFRTLAREAAARVAFPDYDPDACLINRYEPGARLTLHVDRDERDAVSPIVSVSLGLPAVFLFGGMRRSDPTRRLALHHGDVVVWGGPSRFRYHGVLPLEDGEHAEFGRYRINLTFRRAL
jgi:alkylated DNA repair protein (DNA oxidative demethylase)